MNKIKFRKIGNIKFLYFLLTLFIILLSFSSIAIGVANISIKDCFEIFFSNLFSETPETSTEIIIMKLRVPRILLALLTGVNLAVTGAVYQSIFKNSMADPYILGVSSGASLGAAIGFLIGGFIPIFAFVGAIIANALVFLLSGVKGKSSTIRLLLAGIGINYLFSSALALIRTYSNDRQIELFMWGMGNFSTATYKRVIVLALISAPILIYFFLNRKNLNLLLLGEDVAKSLGVDSVTLRRNLLIASSILIATTVSFTGTIGFVGLIIPHMIRMVMGSNYRKNFIFIAMLGMIFLLVCDNISRSVLENTEVPIGIVTSIFGAPYFMYLVYKERKKVEG
ncbi:iron ABC transporter permease [uncultured Clostridium sp.]|jgi:iron complex transport system permease protein|uniref:FecCD family ABC transporter permease n=1 Tax=uncultured Clostridium sp. TaxID=59620 RepID=UPI0026081DE2|nr:iron ABC transporter permease [uncultured Clostridium sp.]